MNPIEALADSIMQFEGWLPANINFRGSRSWRNRNPGNLRPTNSTQQTDGENYRVFTSLASGFQALIMDLQYKMQVPSTHFLKPTSTLLELLNIYAPAGDHNNPSEYCQFICKRTSLILEREITPQTTLEQYAFNTDSRPAVSATTGQAAGTTESSQIPTKSGSTNPTGE